MENQRTSIEDVDEEQMQKIIMRELPNAKNILNSSDIEGFAVMVVTRNNGIKASVHGSGEATLQLVCMMDKYQLQIMNILNKSGEKRSGK